MPVRIDKYLWAVRLFKTRSLATKACDLAKVKLKGHTVKPSRTVQPGDEFQLKFGPFERNFRVIQTVQNRQPARLVPEFCIEITSPDTIELMKAHAAARATWRLPGMGRPTKKERRELDDFMDLDDW